ncbi:stem cell self-renewal protein Piwi [Stanieria cyanosphaera PCC 7437]|uniref:Protein argonaute n=1 Tax=Stanieria cyanosphaera (strain ATCC 29371 / PCC 7437) TaxID=111780 RepID=K9XZC6_STAC7|nr:argonaute PAZ domain-containing protein [Stanieria cyanosphaera]AFZ37878.1 stem cell self-renewal protein Piwi [Stanieria cyanosphaera PCC 7437]
MNNSAVEVFLNRFPVKRLTEAERTVQTYTYTFNPSPEPGKEYSAINRITWNIGTPGVRFGSTIITKQPIAERYLQGENWLLKPQGTQLLDLNNSNEKEALERLERRWLGWKLRQTSEKYRLENSPEGGFIWWNLDKTILQGLGWEVHTGVCLDISIHHSGVVLTEIDIHHRFYTSWTLEQWLQTYPDLSINWVRNTYNDRSWKFERISDENPETVMIPSGSLADYHRNLENNQAKETEISNAKVVYVSSKGNQEIPHLSTRLQPSITMEMLSCLQDRGSQEAAKVFKQIRQSSQVRFDRGRDIAKWLASKIYHVEKQINPQKAEGIMLRNKFPLLITKSKKVYRPEASFKQGCFRTGEKQFGCLDLTGNGDWSELIRNKLEDLAQKSGVDILLEPAKKTTDLPDSLLTRKQFWQDWANQGTHTVLVITPWLQNTEKSRLQREALEANIALQFMQPMSKPDNYRAVNIILGLLLKAKWQPVGLEPLQDEYAAELVIGFDAGTNRNLYYGTSAFAILANGQSLGWELPEAQPGEKLSGQAVLNTVANIINRFQRIENRLPKRILLLRDGIVQRDEFESAIALLQQDHIAVDLLGVRKSGAGRMAVIKQTSGNLIDVLPGTAVLSHDGETFRIVTSEAKAGGSARPLQVLRDYGDAPLEILARQIDRLCLLNPASGYSVSRLPYVIHFADKMAKIVQRIGEVGVLQGIDRQKIFFA